MPAGAARVTIPGDGVLLRPFTADEVPLVWEGHERLRLERGHGHLAARDPQEAAKALARVQRHVAASGTPLSATNGLLHLAIERLSDSHLIGEIDARRVPRPSTQAAPAAGPRSGSLTLAASASEARFAEGIQTPAPDLITVEVGIELYRPEDRGHDAGTAALRALLDYLWRETPTQLVQATTTPENAPMRHVLTKLGFHHVEPPPGALPDLVLYQVAAPQDHRQHP